MAVQGAPTTVDQLVALAARGIADQEMHRPRRVLFGCEHRKRSRAGCQMEKSTTREIHRFVLSANQI
jgi:hypothetical protein